MPQEQFGLGIQVFKIEAGKEEERQKGRKAIKQIENPKRPKQPQPVPSHFVKSPSELVKTPDNRKMTAERKQRILPSLSQEKNQLSRDNSVK